METKFVSLGCVCQPHAQIERTGMVAPGFFDLLGSSWADLIRVLRNPHDDSGLDAIAWGDRSSVRGRESGLIMHHEFPRDEAGRVIITDEGRALCAARLRRRMKRFLALKGDVTFVRLGGGRVADRGEPLPVRVKKNASKQKVRAQGLTESGREML
ncbi:MAG: hypothetical protein H7236_17950 [Gemmatimonadaceae bacterium]|nr:hypothetical protein [Caulobacter sp.]